jgi:hypothetical protein
VNTTETSSLKRLSELGKAKMQKVSKFVRLFQKPSICTGVGGPPGLTPPMWTTVTQSDAKTAHAEPSGAVKLWVARTSATSPGHQPGP